MGSITFVIALALGVLRDIPVHLQYLSGEAGDLSPVQRWADGRLTG